MDCSTLYEEINDERFSTIFKEHTEVNYEEILINYCCHNFTNISVY